MGKISMYLATLIVVAHMIIPHQHKAKLQTVIHECLFDNNDLLEKDESSLIGAIADLIKHVNLGEKHLETFKISNYKYQINSISIFEVPEINFLRFQFKELKRSTIFPDYNLLFSHQSHPRNLRLRAPPII
ncbi:hypothetical protein ETU10_05855 [Apibacter muscae]|uniref:hypothetical protein n=1 Tax=Apibacter muscae TaxID=2509004 RepID=UPI0011AC58D3|nr:hypothetical protein [Apibacter muscae]TWP23755.1 hypothetical protein ETU10_05855 [Apibacter muscae]